MASISIQINKLRVTPDALSGKSDVTNRLAVKVGATASSVTFTGKDGDWLDATTIAGINGGYLVKDQAIGTQPGQNLALQLFFFKEVPIPKIIGQVLGYGVSLIPGWGSLASEVVGLIDFPDHYEVPLGYREIVIPGPSTAPVPESVELVAPQEEQAYVFEPGAAEPTKMTLAARGAVTLAAGLTVTIA